MGLDVFLLVGLHGWYSEKGFCRLKWGPTETTWALATDNWQIATAIRVLTYCYLTKLKQNTRLAATWAVNSLWRKIKKQFVKNPTFLLEAAVQPSHHTSSVAIKWDIQKIFHHGWHHHTTIPQNLKISNTDQLLDDLTSLVSCRSHIVPLPHNNRPTLNTKANTNSNHTELPLFTTKCSRIPHFSKI